jgi:hypothetical protein
MLGSGICWYGNSEWPAQKRLAILLFDNTTIALKQRLFCIQKTCIEQFADDWHGRLVVNLALPSEQITCNDNNGTGTGYRNAH